MRDSFHDILLASVLMCMLYRLLYAAKVLPFTREEVRRAFKVLAGDKDPDGFISPDVLERALIKYCSHKVCVECI